MIQNLQRITTISILPLPKRETRRAKNDPDPIPDQDPYQDQGLADHDQNLMNVQEKDPTKREKRKDEGNPEASPELQIMKPKIAITIIHNLLE
jgi:hypothetical protein